MDRYDLCTHIPSIFVFYGRCPTMDPAATAVVCQMERERRIAIKVTLWNHAHNYWAVPCHPLPCYSWFSSSLSSEISCINQRNLEHCCFYRNVNLFVCLNVTVWMSIAINLHVSLTSAMSGHTVNWRRGPGARWKGDSLVCRTDPDVVAWRRQKFLSPPEIEPLLSTPEQLTLVTELLVTGTCKCWY
jgi:hypothetical protein